MLHLLRKQIILTFSACFIVLMACAQERELYRTEHDNLPYYFGIYLAYNNTYLHPDKHPKFLQDDSVLVAEPGAKGGVALGFLATFKLSDHWEFRLNPNLIIGGAKYFEYTLNNPLPGEAVTQKKTLPSSIFTFPLQFKFNSDRIDNFRVYMMGDVYVSSDLMSNAGNRNAEDLIKLKRMIMALKPRSDLISFLNTLLFHPNLNFPMDLLTFMQGMKILSIAAFLTSCSRECSPFLLI